jgi:hypothetical protein
MNVDAMNWPNLLPGPAGLMYVFPVDPKRKN